MTRTSLRLVGKAASTKTAKAGKKSTFKPKGSPRKKTRTGKRMPLVSRKAVSTGWSLKELYLRMEIRLAQAVIKHNAENLNEVARLVQLQNRLKKEFQPTDTVIDKRIKYLQKMKKAKGVTKSNIVNIDSVIADYKSGRTTYKHGTVYYYFQGKQLVAAKAKDVAAEIHKSVKTMKQPNCKEHVFLEITETGSGYKKANLKVYDVSIYSLPEDGGHHFYPARIQPCEADVSKTNPDPERWNWELIERVYLHDTGATMPTLSMNDASAMCINDTYWGWQGPAIDTLADGSEICANRCFLEAAICDPDLEAKNEITDYRPHTFSFATDLNARVQNAERLGGPLLAAAMYTARRTWFVWACISSTESSLSLEVHEKESVFPSQISSKPC